MTIGLQALQGTRDSCVGYGCLSLRRCALYNAKDTAAGRGSGSQWLRDETGGSDRGS
jgi:MerR family redox-sensitive transcriptional activator SoxR